MLNPLSLNMSIEKVLAVEGLVATRDRAIQLWRRMAELMSSRSQLLETPTKFGRGTNLRCSALENVWLG